MFWRLNASTAMDSFHTSESWAAILRVPEFVPISRRKEERHEEEANTDDSNDDNDSDDDDDNNNIRERAETEHMVPTEPVQNRNPQARQRRITLGQRWCQTYIPEDQIEMVYHFTSAGTRGLVDRLLQPRPKTTTFETQITQES